MKKSFAKINLMLEINGKDASSGYHKLQTLICTLEDYHDSLEITPAEKFSITLKGEYAFEGENILEKTAKLFIKEFGGNVNFNVKLTKNIKFGAGLGGGSSNAGVFLNFLLKENGIILSKKEYSDFAFKIGADVPFFYNESPKICEGFGEELSEIQFAMPRELYAILVLPEFSVSTISVFKSFEASDILPAKKIQNFQQVLTSKNSLTKYAINLQPEIANIISQLSQLPNVLKADMSGSGSACFALFESLENAKKAKNLLPQNLKCVISKVKIKES